MWRIFYMHTHGLRRYYPSRSRSPERILSAVCTCTTIHSTYILSVRFRVWDREHEKLKTRGFLIGALISTKNMLFVLNTKKLESMFCTKVLWLSSPVPKKGSNKLGEAGSSSTAVLLSKYLLNGIGRRRRCFHIRLPLFISIPLYYYSNWASSLKTCLINSWVVYLCSIAETFKC